MIRSHYGRVGTAIAAALLAAAGSASAAASPALASTSPAAQHAAAQHAGTQHAGTQHAGTPAAGPRGLSRAQASAEAKATGRPVIATALTSAESETTANPNGTFRLTQTLLPVRALRQGHWLPLNADLKRAGSRLVPAVSTNPLSLSGGGTSALAVIAGAGRTLSLYWPHRLPAPTVTGATATYHNVFPGVNLVVTAGEQAGFSETLVVRNPAAARNPALRSIKIRAVPSPGLHLSANAAGDLIVTAGGKAEPVFNEQAPLMWDSAPPPAHMRTVKAGGVLVNARSGMPAYSSASSPGAGAHVARIGITAAGQTITLTPPAAALRRTPRKDYPLYVDGSYHAAISGDASNWTQVDSGFATTTYWKESSDLQMGYCDFSGCNGLGVARSLFTMPISSTLHGSTIVESDAYIDDVWSASCTKEEVEMWVTKAISSSTDWNTQAASGFWIADEDNPSFAYGYSGCDPGGEKVGFTVTGAMKTYLSGSTLTLGIKAGSESNDLYWKQFDSGAKNITISTEYYFPPNAPSSPKANGACGTSSDPNTIGNDDVTFAATQYDKDGDPSLTTTFTILNSSGDSPGTGSSFSVSGGDGSSGTSVSSVVPRTTILDWNANGGVYHWSAVTKDENGVSGSASTTCYFDWNPSAPGAPDVTVSSPSQAIGQTVTATITPPYGCGGTTSPCPTSYTYQLGSAAPQTATVGTGSCTSTSCPVTLTINQLGPITIDAAGIAATNPGPTGTATVTGTAPSPVYQDGYFSGGTYPDLLTLGTGTTPSLWLSQGTGNGAVGPAVDIGSVGTGINPGSDGPADWVGAQISHGDFTGDGVQDVLAYYPAGNSPGYAQIIPGGGDADTLESVSANDAQIPSVAWEDPYFPNPADIPFSLVAAGNASQTGSGLADLIGIYGDSSNGYELDLFTTSPGQEGNYGYLQTLTPAATGGPDGNPWNDFQLATTQPAGNPSAAILFALDTVNGELWESQNPGCPSACSATTLIGMPGTWTQITGTTPPNLVSADINEAGATELWSVSGSTATAYTVSGATISKDSTSSALVKPNDDWPFTDGVCGGSTPATALDTLTNINASIHGTVSWTCDNTFVQDLSFDGTNTFVVPPAATVPTTATTLILSLWFKTNTAGGVIASLQGQPVADGGTITADYNPVLYVGTDGLLNAEWWPAGLITSKAAVDDGLWHHAVITASSGSETLYLDGTLQGSTTGTPNPGFSSPNNLTFGSGYIGGNWPDEPHYKSSTASLDYFNGQVADVTFTQ
jgi:Concanavalin A-like lectin/glucanases superfamily